MNKRFLFLLFVASLLFFITGCEYRHKPVNSELVERVNKRKNDPWNIHIVDSSIGLLKTGDIVVRRGNDITSYMLCQLNSKDKTYSHCGLVLVEDGYPYVYHCIGGEDNPDQVLRRDSAGFWLSAARNEAYGIVRTDIADSSLPRLNDLVRQYYGQRKKFDMQFDIVTEDRFYCAEFIYKTFNRSTGDNSFVEPVTVMGYTFVGIDNLFLNRHARFVCQIRFK